MVLHKWLAVGGQCFLVWPIASCPHFNTSSWFPLTGDETRDNKASGGVPEKAENPWCWLCNVGCFDMLPGGSLLKANNSVLPEQ